MTTTKYLGRSGMYIWQYTNTTIHQHSNTPTQQHDNMSIHQHDNRLSPTPLPTLPLLSLLPPSTMTAIAAANDHHCRCHTVDDACQKPLVILCCWQQQRRSLSREVAVNGNRGNGGLYRQRSLSMEATVGWRDNDAIASSTMVSLADGGGSNGGGCWQLCRSSWCRRHHPFIGVDGGGKDAIAATAINYRFHWGQLLLLTSTATIATAKSIVNVGGGLSRRQQQRQGQMQLVLGCKDVLWLRVCVSSGASSDVWWSPLVFGKRHIHSHPDFPQELRSTASSIKLLPAHILQLVLGCQELWVGIGVLIFSSAQTLV